MCHISLRLQDYAEHCSFFWVSCHSAFTNQEIGELLRDVLLHASERDLVMQADLVASCSSVLRFLYIRDKVRCLRHSL